MDKNILKKLISDNLSTYEIATQLNISQTNVRYWLRKHGFNTNNLSQDKTKKNSLNGKQCIQCNTNLTGSKHMYCNKTCKSKYHYHNNILEQNGNTNERQRKVSYERKLLLIQLKGGSCRECGYNKNSAALQFHHRDPENKTFNLDSRKLSNSKWESVLKEADKCDLLCANCHMEIHYPEKNMVLPVGADPTTRPL